MNKFIKFRDCLPCYQCKRLVSKDKIIPMKNKQYACENCYIPSKSNS